MKLFLGLAGMIRFLRGNNMEAHAAEDVCVFGCSSHQDPKTGHNPIDDIIDAYWPEMPSFGRQNFKAFIGQQYETERLFYSMDSEGETLEESLREMGIFIEEIFGVPLEEMEVNGDSMMECPLRNPVLLSEIIKRYAPDTEVIF